MQGSGGGGGLRLLDGLDGLAIVGGLSEPQSYGAPFSGSIDDRKGCADARISLNSMECPISERLVGG